MKTIIRNFLFILRRFKTATLLNVLGLSVAYLAFMLIMMQVKFDTEFDRCQPNADAIVRVTHGVDGERVAVTSRPEERTMREMSPHIKAGTIMNSWNGSCFFAVDREGRRENFKEPSTTVSKEIAQVFHFSFIEGDSMALEQPNSAIIPLSLARRLFGNHSALGKPMLSVPGGETLYTITGVYQDFPGNSTLQNLIYQRMSDDENYDGWSNRNYLAYFLLDDATNQQATLDIIKKNLTPGKFYNSVNSSGEAGEWGKNGVDLSFISLPELHFTSNIDYDPLPKASRQTILVLISIALVVLVIAGINFTNFSTAITPMRIKSINTQKVLGSSDGVLRGSLLAEAVLISAAAYLLSLGMLHLAGKLGMQSLIEADMAFGAQGLILASTAGVALLLGLLAGLYPSYYITSFPPALVLKGSFGLSPKGKQLRNVLVGVQFVASITLIIGALFMSLQNHYMQNNPLGYDKEVVLVTDINNNINQKREAFTSQLSALPDVAGVTFANVILSSQDTYMGWGRKLGDQDINFQCIPVSASFLQVMGVEVTEGRDFRPEDETKATACYLFNQKAADQYGIKVGDKLGNDEVVGIVPNVKFASMRTEVSPMAFLMWGKNQWGYEGNSVFYPYAYIKVKNKGNLYAVREQVEKTLKGIDPHYPFQVRLYDQVLENTYKAERKIVSLITLFSLVAVFISIVGVFGLVMFDCEYRRKEIGVRKVMGSTTGQILLMFNTGYLRILLICFVLAAPVAGYGVSVWLESFAYRIPIYWWVFAIALGLVSAITLLTVTFQSWQVANDNPIESIKTT